jgi:hypothetical protein
MLFHNPTTDNSQFQNDLNTYYVLMQLKRWTPTQIAHAPTV